MVCPLDDADRLIGERTPHDTWTWQYDAAGNRTHEHRLHECGVYGYQTDTYYDYDAANQLQHTHRLRYQSEFYDPYALAETRHTYFAYDAECRGVRAWAGSGPVGPPPSPAHR